MKFTELSLGQVFTTKSIKVTKENITRFASEFDPQYMHLDEKKAEKGMFNGIIASGMHTLALSFKLWVEEEIYGEDVIAGTQMNNVKFIKPVFPDDILFVIVKVIDIKKLKKDQGILTVLLETFNDRDEKVLNAELSAIMKL
ncbi:MaoC family dehydratase [Oceanobacillus iheyensis]|uniref:MaoC family dehydratase n=1 Tax=Oceanobacillus iheyensis TaxID=182710 RepID=UPI00363CC9E2